MTAFVAPLHLPRAPSPSTFSQCSTRRAPLSVPVPQRGYHTTPQASFPPSPFPDLPTPDHHENLHWKDRVALYAQFSAEETLHALLLALRDNALSGPRKDDGIDALYAFANLDIWALSHRFFGKKMDLGQFERFKRVVVAAPYDVLLRDYRTHTLSALHVTPDVYVTRRTFEYLGDEKVFTFTLAKSDFGTAEKRAWMVDSIICETAQL